MSERKYKAFAFTIRPKEGLTDPLKEEFLNWVKKKDGGFIVLEGEGTSLHMHGGMFLETETSKSNFNMQLQRHFERHRQDGDSTRVQRGGTRILYNMKFLTDYLSKEDSRVIYESVPENVDEYFPSDLEQEKAKKSSVDSVLAQYEFLLREQFVYEKYEDVEKIDEHLFDIWFVKKLMKAPREKKKKRELSDNLKRWMFPEFFGVDW